VGRAAELAALGHRRLAKGEAHRLSAAFADDPDARVRAAALGSLVRRAAASRARDAWHVATTDANAPVRRRAANLAPALAARDADALVAPLITMLGDLDVTVVEAAAYALGELGAAAVDGGAVAALSTTVTDHKDPIAREAAVAAIGALGDPAGLPAVLTACDDKPAVRRRAVLALAPFDGPDVDAALAKALEDKDWQVRQAAEDLMRSSDH
jgi:HEAT repeat protein